MIVSNTFPPPGKYYLQFILPFDELYRELLQEHQQLKLTVPVEVYIEEWVMFYGRRDLFLFFPNYDRYKWSGDELRVVASPANYDRAARFYHLVHNAMVRHLEYENLPAVLEIHPRRLILTFDLRPTPHASNHSPYPPPSAV